MIGVQVSASGDFMFVVGSRNIPIVREDLLDLAVYFQNPANAEAIRDGASAWSRGIWQIECAGEFERRRDSFRERTLLRCRERKWHFEPGEMEVIGESVLEALGG